MWIENILIQAPEFHLAGNKELIRLQNFLFVVDVTESPIQRPKKTASKVVLFEKNSSDYQPDHA